MRLLLCTDTHGRLRELNTLAAEHEADAILHAGDVGLYLDLANLSTRELQLRVKHAHLPHTVVDPARIASLSRPRLEALVHEHGLVGDFRELVEGAWALSVPTYVVWGNHEEGEAVQALRSGQVSAPNLFIVDENNIHELAGGAAYIGGLGGNCVPARLFSEEPAMAGGKVSMNAAQMTALKTAWDQLDPDAYRIFLTHVSPARELVMNLFVAQLLPDLCISGHMGAPRPISYNYYGLGTRSALDAAWTRELNEDTILRKALREHRDFAAMLGVKREQGRLVLKQGVPYGFTKKVWFLNLPDANMGGGLLDLDFETRRIRTELWCSCRFRAGHAGKDAR